MYSRYIKDMPLKSGPNKGELSAPEIRKLIRGHNKLTNIKVPPGLDRAGLIKFLKSKRYAVDHVNKMLIDKSMGQGRGRKIDLEKAERLTKPVPKTEEQKAATKAKKDVKVAATKKREGDLIKAGATLAKVRADTKVKKAANVKKKAASDELDRRVAVRTAQAKKRTDILKENGIPTLEDYRSGIEKISGGKILSELSAAKRKAVADFANSVEKKLSAAGATDMNVLSPGPASIMRDVGNLERHFDFLATKLLKKA